MVRPVWCKDRAHRLRPAADLDLRSRIACDVGCSIPRDVGDRVHRSIGSNVDRDVRTALLGGRLRQRGWLRSDVLERMIRQHTGGQRDHAHRLWALLALELWAEEYLDRARVPEEVLR